MSKKIDLHYTEDEFKKFIDNPNGQKIKNIIWSKMKPIYDDLENTLEDIDIEKLEYIEGNLAWAEWPIYKFYDDYISLFIDEEIHIIAINENKDFIYGFREGFSSRMGNY